MHPHNIFLTLTYNDEHLTSSKLVYEDFQKFMKKLRKLQDAPMGVFVTGEYGEKNKRPHWHAIIFNYAPKDGVLDQQSPQGDTYTSETINKIWGKGRANYGAVTFQSAGYCARYAAKKLVHGKDGHDYEPISKKSSKHAIGKRWLETFHADVFNQGHIVLPDGQTCSIPRYYEKWFKEKQPENWLSYVALVKLEKTSRAAAKAAAEIRDDYNANTKRRLIGIYTNQTTRAEARAIIQKSKFKMLQDNLKL